MQAAEARGDKWQAGRQPVGGRYSEVHLSVATPLVTDPPGSGHWRAVSRTSILILPLIATSFGFRTSSWDECNVEGSIACQNGL